MAHVAVQVQQQVADAVAGLVGTPPDLLVGERFDALAQAGPVLLHELSPRELEEECGEFGKWVRCRIMVPRCSS